MDGMLVLSILFAILFGFHEKQSMVMATDADAKALCSVNLAKVLPPPYGGLENMVCQPVWNSFLLRYSQSKDNVITIVLSTIYTSGWIGMGFSPDGMMINSSCMVGWVTPAGHAKIKQYYVEGFKPSKIIPDKCSNHKQSCNNSCGTTTTTQEPAECNEFISALAAGMSAKLIVEVTTEGSSPSTVALAAAARQTGGKLVCIIPEPKLDKTQKVIQETGLNEMVEFRTGDPVEILHNYENIDFSLVDYKTNDYDTLMEKLDVNPKRAVVVTNNLEGRKGNVGQLKKMENNNNKVKVRSLQHPIGKGLEVTMIGKSTEFGKKERLSKSGCHAHLIRGEKKMNDKSKWVFVVDEKSGEEHIYRVPKSSGP